MNEDEKILVAEEVAKWTYLTLGAGSEGVWYDNLGYTSIWRIVFFQLGLCDANIEVRNALEMWSFDPHRAWSKTYLEETVWKDIEESGPDVNVDQLRALAVAIFCLSHNKWVHRNIYTDVEMSLKNRGVDEWGMWRWQDASETQKTGFNMLGWVV